MRIAIILLWCGLLSACGPMTHEQVSASEKRCFDIGGTIYYDVYATTKQVDQVWCEVNNVRYKAGNF